MHYRLGALTTHCTLAILRSGRAILVQLSRAVRNRRLSLLPELKVRRLGLSGLLRLPVGVALAWTCVLWGCGGGGGAVTQVAVNPTPHVDSVAPMTIVLGGHFTLTVSGTGFIPSSTVEWNGSSRATTFLSSTQLQATITSDSTTAPGGVTARVTNPSPGGGVSNTVSFYIFVPPPVGVGVVQMVSVATDGAAGNGNSYTHAALSADGRYVAFQSDSSNLISGPASGYADIYLRDTCLGAPSVCSPNTVRISVAADGSPANGNSRTPSISADGRFVAFDSSASNLVAGDTNGQPDVFVRDTCIGALAGCLPSTIRASLAYDGSQGNNDSREAWISGQGRYVVFHSLASNLVSNVGTNQIDVFVRDTCNTAPSGCVPTTTRVSIAADGTQGNGPSFRQEITGDGRFAVFMSYATNLIPGGVSGPPHIFVHDSCTAAQPSCMPSISLVDVASDGNQANDRADNTAPPAISPDGTVVAYGSFASNLVSGKTNGVEDVFVSTNCLSGLPGNACPRATTRVSVGFDGAQANGGSGDPAISMLGRFVAFDSLASNLVPGGTSAPQSVFIRDSCNGTTNCTPNTFLLSVGTDGSQGNGISKYPNITSDGHYGVFISSATNLIANASNGKFQVWLAKVY